MRPPFTLKENWFERARKMQFINQHKLLSVHPIQMGLFVLIELQLLFGKQFTTFHLYGPFHLSDALFAFIALIAIFVIWKNQIEIPVNRPLFILFGISFVYLLYSVSASLGPYSYVIRHYALFMYFGFSYIIFYSFITDESAGLNSKFIILVGIIAVSAQVLTHIYNLVTTQDYLLRIFSDFNFMTELIMPGLVIFQVWVLVMLKDPKRKSIIVILILLLTTTLGHASAFLASIIPLLLYILSKLKTRPIFLVTGTLTSLIILFLILPQFKDVNAMWRVLYWREVIKEGIVNYYGIFGHGFGGAFITENMNQAFLNELGSIHFDVNPEEKYLTPMHNSFITIMFHIGIIPGFLIFLPLRNAVDWFFKYDGNKQRMFLFLSFLGFAIWSSFNVILEMPHSSAFFWLMYFSVVYEFRNRNEKTVRFSFNQR